jgi:2-phosphosulfolactate phosphatase
MPRKVHVLFKRHELSGTRLEDKIVVVLDVVFATTTIVTALHAGAADVVPAMDADEARQLAGSLGAMPHVLAGESQTERIPGFATPHPLELAAHGIAGKRVLYATSNGTVALRMAQNAAAVYAAGIVNARATAQHIAQAHPSQTVLVVCAGVGDGFNLEDLVGAGHVVNELALADGANTELTDAALAAQALATRWPAAQALAASRVGRMMARAGLLHEIHHAAQVNALEVVARLQDGLVRRLM